MNEIDFYHILNSDFDKDRYFGISVEYTLGGAVLNYWGQPAPEKMEGLILHLPAIDGPPEYQALLLKQALERKGFGDFLHFFADRFYLYKAQLPNALFMLKEIPWLKDIQRSAAHKVSISHTKDPFFQDRLNHSASLAVLFHKDFKTLEKSLEAQTLRLSKLKSAKDLRNNPEKDLSSGSAFPLEVDGKIYLITAEHVRLNELQMRDSPWMPLGY